MYVIGAILAFSVLVIVHELGHFTLAKLNGVKVEEFSLGMGPKLVGIKGKETEYIIKLFPVGGYVKMLGEEGDSSDPRAFTNKTSAQKLSVIAAGPLMNLVMAVVFFGIIASARGYLEPVISKVEQNLPAKTAGFQPGDEIIKVNGHKIGTWEEFVNDVYVGKGATLTVTVERNKELKTLEVTPVKDPKEGRYLVGISPTVVDRPSLLQSVKRGFTETGSFIKQTVMFFGGVFKGRVSSSDFGGPITVIRVSAEAAKAGILTLTWFAAYLSVQLAIFNIIPFPALDGGWIFMLLFEIITRKKIDDKKVAVINYIGFIFLMALMVLVVIKDILYPIKL